MNFDRFDFNTSSWNCPSLEQIKRESKLNEKEIAAPSHIEEAKKRVKEMKKKSGNSWLTLPLWQNLEAVVYGMQLSNTEEYRTFPDYCVKNLEELRDFEFHLVKDPRIEILLETIDYFKDQVILLELEAPFSVLAALMNPIDLYACFDEKGELLSEILYKLAQAEAEYVKRAVEAGTRILSLADPVGTMDMTGEKYYRQFCGESERYLLTLCEPYLNQAVMHICKKMSQSLVIGGLACADKYEGLDNTEDFTDALLRMADDPEIRFTGMTCIHDQSRSRKTSYIIRPNLALDKAKERR